VDKGSVPRYGERVYTGAASKVVVGQGVRAYFTLGMILVYLIPLIIFGLLFVAGAFMGGN